VLSETSSAVKPKGDHTRICLLAQRLTESPAFVYDEGAILRALRALEQLRATAECRILFALKSCAVAHVLSLIAPHVDGFATSSLFEATLARQVIGDMGTVHMTTPGLRPDEIRAIAQKCDYVSFNSLSQWEQLRGEVGNSVECGLRINPQLSFLEDERYDPCRKHSKLGVPLDQLVGLLKTDPGRLSAVRGVHFHTNCESDDLAPVLKTVRHVEAGLGGFLGKLAWVNIGGGYLVEQAENRTCLHKAVGLLKDTHGVEVFFEPGAAVVREAGYLMTTVLDMFDSGGWTIAVLDTTVNHAPEVFEYQYRPAVLGDCADGRHRYVLAGCTCLAGDLFGEYAFEEPLQVGSRVVFSGMGAYTLVKAHMFNGVNLPAVYALTADGDLSVKKRFSYSDFASRCGADGNVPV